MPIIQGFCAPFVCITGSVPDPTIKVTHSVTVGGAKQPDVDVTNDPNYAQVVAKGRKMLHDQDSIQCDGCHCMKLLKYAPPPTAPVSVVVETSTDTAADGTVTVHTYTASGTWRMLSFGMCVPPGTKVKVGEKWVPVQDAPDMSKTYVPQSGGGSGSKSGGGGGKKKKAAPPVVKKGKATKRPVAKKSKSAKVKRSRRSASSSRARR